MADALDETDERLILSIVEAFEYIYRTLGFGFLESVYTAAMERVLKARAHRVQREVGVRVMFEGAPIAWQRIDMVVDGRLIVEIKSTRKLSDSARRQLQNYMSATHMKNGIILHFGEKPAWFRLSLP